MQKIKYRVHIRSRPGDEAHEVSVVVRAKNIIDAENLAVDEMKASFPSRPKYSWLIDRVEQLPS